MGREKELVIWFENLRNKDIPLVGGKNANLGEMIASKLPVPPGYALTAYAYDLFITKTKIKQKIQDLLKKVDVNDSKQLGGASQKIRELIESAEMPKEIAKAALDNYKKLTKRLGFEPFVAVRSSATAEDLPGASFAGQQETFLNIKGTEQLLDAIKKCWSSLFTPRAIFYRQEQGFDHSKVLLSVGIQKMVNSKAAGVMFSLNVSTGDEAQIMIEGNWGLGESVVSGSVTPDEFVLDKKSLKILDRKIATKSMYYFRNPKTGSTIHRPTPTEMRTKPCVSDNEIKLLAELCNKIEEHYGREMDMEWAIDGDFKFPKSVMIVQARPETVWSKAKKETAAVTASAPFTGKQVVRGLPASPGIGIGAARIVPDVADIEKVQPGDVLVTKMTTPDWVPAMRKAKAIVTEEGGSTSHAAIVSRELGIPAIVGTGNAMSLMKNGVVYTVDGKAGIVYEGAMEQKTTPAGAVVVGSTTEPYLPTGTKIYMNLGVPDKIEEYSVHPFDGIGLMRIEFIIATYVKKHPLHLLEIGQGNVYRDTLAEGIAQVARKIAPRPLIVRFSDFKTNEYRELEGGEKFEPKEDNPMIGWRGVSRYISKGFEQAFRLECRAILKCREEYKLKNVHVMYPFVRTTWELDKANKILESEGLVRTRDFKVFLMAEVPSIIFEVEEFCDYCDGFSIGSNDLTQGILAADRDSTILAEMGYFDERDPAVKRAIAHLIKHAHAKGKTVGICGQAPSDKPDFVEFLVKHGIDSISVNPDAVAAVRENVADLERRILLQNAIKL